MTPHHLLRREKCQRRTQYDINAGRNRQDCHRRGKDQKHQAKPSLMESFDQEAESRICLRVERKTQIGDDI